MIFTIGDKVKLSGCPFDEQIIAEALMYTFLKDRVFVVTEVQRVFEEGSSGQWIKTDHTPDFIDSYWFKKADA